MDALRYSLSGELLKGHGGVVEAKGAAEPTRTSIPISVEEPVNTLLESDVITETGPTDVAPPRQRVSRVFSSIRYDD